MDKFTGMISKQELRVGNKVAVDICNDYYNGYEVKIDSLHQLQNLFYCLTGQELEINL